jgi:hypothetical protein
MHRLQHLSSYNKRDRQKGKGDEGIVAVVQTQAKVESNMMLSSAKISLAHQVIGE